MRNPQLITKIQRNGKTDNYKKLKSVKENVQFGTDTNEGSPDLTRKVTSSGYF